jgi:hypothetical protein
MTLARRLRPKRRIQDKVPWPVRMFLLASIAVAGSVYALVRYYARPPLPMFVQVPIVDAGEISAPDLEYMDR